MLLITEKTRSYFGPHISSRMNDIANYVNPRTSCYTAHRTPTPLVFGTDGGGADDYTAYAVDHGKRVKGWLVGELQAYTRKTNKKEPGKIGNQLSVAIKPLVDADTARLVQYLTKEARPELCKCHIISNLRLYAYTFTYQTS